MGLTHYCTLMLLVGYFSLAFVCIFFLFPLPLREKTGSLFVILGLLFFFAFLPLWLTLYYNYTFYFMSVVGDKEATISMEGLRDFSSVSLLRYELIQCTELGKETWWSSLTPHNAQALFLLSIFSRIFNNCHHSNLLG